MWSARKFTHTHTHTHMHAHTPHTPYINTQTLTGRQIYRLTDRRTDRQTDTNTHTHTHIYIYIYIYILRETERKESTNLTRHQLL